MGIDNLKERYNNCISKFKSIDLSDFNVNDAKEDYCRSLEISLRPIIEEMSEVNYQFLKLKHQEKTNEVDIATCRNYITYSSVHIQRWLNLYINPISLRLAQLDSFKAKRRDVLIFFGSIIFAIILFIVPNSLDRKNLGKTEYQLYLVRDSIIIKGNKISELKDSLNQITKYLSDSILILNEDLNKKIKDNNQCFRMNKALNIKKTELIKENNLLKKKVAPLNKKSIID